MNPSALQILRAAMERIAKLGGKEIDAEPTCLQCCESLASCDDDNPWCPGRQARAALEAAAKAEAEHTGHRGQCDRHGLSCRIGPEHRGRCVCRYCP